MERRLAAIFAADVVGYSRLMEADELGTLRSLKLCETEVIEPLVAEKKGRIVKRMGDGFPVAFASVVDAVGCGGAGALPGGPPPGRGPGMRSRGGAPRNREAINSWGSA